MNQVTPTVPKPVVLHLLVPNENGPIQSLGLPGTPHHGTIRRFHVACDSSHPTLPQHATGETRAVTCPLCKKAAEFKVIKELEEAGSDLDARALKAMEAEQKIKDAGKCAGC